MAKKKIKNKGGRKPGHRDKSSKIKKLIKLAKLRKGKKRKK